MKVSTRGRYALRMMLDIATNDHGEPVRIKDIAARQDISVKYLEQIVSVLTKAGYVKSIRGPQGGYRLARLPKDYTIGMILRLTEGIFLLWHARIIIMTVRKCRIVLQFVYGRNWMRQSIQSLTSIHLRIF